MYIYPFDRSYPVSTGQLVPYGAPEAAGVYELTGQTDRQLSYGDQVLMQGSNGSTHQSVPGAYIEDIIPETGKIVVSWFDGTQSHVDRSECMMPVQLVSVRYGRSFGDGGGAIARQLVQGSSWLCPDTSPTHLSV